MKDSIRQILRAIQSQTGKGFKPIANQALEIVSLYLKKGLHPGEYYAYGLASQQISKVEIDAYVSTKWYWNEHVPRLASSAWTPILHNKWLFHLHYCQHGLSLPRTLGLLHGTSGITTDGEPLRNAGELRDAIKRFEFKSLVCKPVTGIGGSGVLIYDQVGYELTEPDQTRTPSEISEEITAVMCANKKSVGFVIQERVSDHPFLQEINPFTPSAIRVVTLRCADGGIHIPLSGVRFGRKGSTVDNLSQGGTSAYVNPDSGRIGQGLSRPQYLRKFTEIHPDTGVRFTGKVVPEWNAVRALCMRAAEVTPGIHAIGWDVLLSPSGPVLLEGNHDWELSIHQSRTRGYITPEVRQFLNSHGVRMTLGSERRRRPISRQDHCDN